MSESKHIMVVAGELSGDQHAGCLVTQLRASHPGYVFTGIGGKNMRAAGVETFFDLTPHGIMGFMEVLKHVSVIRQAWSAAKQHLTTHKPDLLILVDYPGFNLRLAKYAKQTLGSKVLFYISPQIWAWKYHRVHMIRQCVDHMAVILPFEVAIYQREKVPVSYVGHPLAETVKASRSRADTRARYGLAEDAWVVGLLPGSRRHEISRILPVMLETAAQLAEKISKLTLVLPLAPTLTDEDIQPYLKASKIDVTLTIVRNDTYNLIHCCDSAIVTSGTATLETALLNIPMVIVYKTSWPSYQVARYFVLRRQSQVKHIGLCNIIAEKTVAPELIQHEANADAISQILLRYKNEPGYLKQTKAALAGISTRLKAEKESSTTDAAMTVILQS